MIDISIIVISYNTKNLLEECLLSISKNITSRLTHEIIVVDNASGDNSAEMVRRNFPKVILIANKKNIGYAKGNNLGVKKAKGRYILFLNADTLIYPKTIKTMVNFIDSRADIGAATCRVELINGELDDSCHRGFPTPFAAFCYFSGLSKLFPKVKLFSGYTKTYMDLNKIHEVDSCSGAFMIVRRKSGQEISWWDEDYFWYGEDLDFCFKLKERGWKIYFVPHVKILHYKGVSGGIKKISKHLTIATNNTIVRVTNARFNAMKIFYKKHYENKYPKFITWLVIWGIRIKRWLTLTTL